MGVAELDPGIEEIPASTRRRALMTLFAGVVLMHMALIGASAMATLVTADAIGSAWSGIPNAASVAGTAVGAVVVAGIMVRRTARGALITGYLLAVLGCGIAVLAVLGDALFLLMLGMALIGIGNGAAQMSRYAAAEMYAAEHRGFAVGAVVWAGTAGGVVGPALISPASRVAEGSGIAPLVGPFVVSLIAIAGAAAALFLMPRRAAQPVRSVAATPGIGRGLFKDGMFSIPVVKLALIGMLTAQFTMVGVMTMAPVHIHEHGHGLATTGIVLTAHSLGMFALSPLSGMLTDRYGGRTAISMGIAILVASSLLIVFVPSSGGSALIAALFLLGLGWNLSFVGGSGLLSRDLPASHRTQVQGAVDAFVWGSSAVASVIAGLIFAAGGYAVLAIAGGLLALIPVIPLLRERAHVPARSPGIP